LQPLPKSFYAQNDPVAIARSLLGCYLVRTVDGTRTVGRITETEAYWAPDDQASHARNGRRTGRTETMFGPAGTAYVYLCYGIHHLFNVVTGPVGTPHAVLLRALQPAEGVATMLQRRGFAAFAESDTPPAPDRLKPQLSAGPGVLSQAMAISTRLDGALLTSTASGIWIEDRGDRPPASDIVATQRVGIDFAGAEWVAKPWRFYDRRSRFVSKPR
jgi:DNA-3-methyladenine glycosylase